MRLAKTLRCKPIAWHPLILLVNDRHHLHTITARVQQRLEGYLDKQQEAISGPDLSDRRNVVDKILYTPAIQHAINIDSKENSRELAKSRNLPVVI